MASQIAVDTSTVSPDAKHLSVTMQELLNRTISIFASYNLPIPTRRYYTLGDPAIDCEQVVVTFLQAYIGSPGDQANVPRRCSDPRSGTFNIYVTRAIPIAAVNGTPPTQDKIQNASEIIAYDAYVLLDSAAQLDTWATQGGYGLGVIATVEARTAEGGYQSTVLTITIAIP